MIGNNLMPYKIKNLWRYTNVLNVYQYFDFSSYIITKLPKTTCVVNVDNIMSHTTHFRRNIGYCRNKSKTNVIKIKTN